MAIGHYATLLFLIFLACLSYGIGKLPMFNSASCLKKPERTHTSHLSEPLIRSHAFLEPMYQDGYYPDFLVDKCASILIRLCHSIETTRPKSSEELLLLTHAATESLNDLAPEFEQHDSEIETGAREALGADFEFIVTAYGFDVDVEEVIAPREW